MNVHIPWIKVTLADGVSLSWRSDPSSPDYFTSLSNKRTVEEATEINLNITYCPHVGEDCNRIEKAIASSPFCTVQYGDNYGSKSVTSKVYRAMIINYSTAFNEGYLSYSIKMISTSVVHNFDKVGQITIPPKGKDTAKTLTISDKIKEIVKDYLNDHYVYDETTSKSAIGEGSTAYIKKPITISSGLNPLQAIAKLVQSIPNKDNSKISRVLEIDDTVSGSSNKGTIRIVKYTQEKVGSKLSFEWGTKDGTVLEWSPHYEGSVAIFRNEKVLGANNTFVGNSSYDPVSGKPITITYSKASQAAGDLLNTDVFNAVNKTIVSMNDFIKWADYPYEATLKVLGESQFVTPTQTKITVTPVIMGVAHHSAGVYAAKSITDNVSGTEGFTTTYELYRLSDQGEALVTTSTGGLKPANDKVGNVKNSKDESNKNTKSKESKKESEKLLGGVWYNNQLISYESFLNTDLGTL